MVEHLPRIREVLSSNPSAAGRPQFFFLIDRNAPQPGARLFIWDLISEGGPVEIVESLWATLLPPQLQ